MGLKEGNRKISEILNKIKNSIPYFGILLFNATCLEESFVLFFDFLFPKVREKKENSPQ